MVYRRKWILLLLVGLFALGGCIGYQGPMAVLNTPVISGAAPLDVPFDLSRCVESGNSLISYSLDFGDGTPLAEGNDFHLILHHIYQTPGEFTARLTVTNAQGEENHAQIKITVNKAPPPVGTIMGMTAPDFTAHTTDGGEVHLADLHGNVVLLEFWGVWCDPCKTSMPHLQDLYDQYANRGLVVIAISTDNNEQDTIDFLTNHGYTDFISVWEPGGKSGNRIAQLYGVSSSLVGIPRTFLLDRQGVIRYVGHPDSLDPQLVEGLL